jgi:hypothetical protein
MNRFVDNRSPIKPEPTQKLVKSEQARFIPETEHPSFHTLIGLRSRLFVQRNLEFRKNQAWIYSRLTLEISQLHHFLRAFL